MMRKQSPVKYFLLTLTVLVFLNGCWLNPLEPNEPTQTPEVTRQAETQAVTKVVTPTLASEQTGCLSVGGRVERVTFPSAILGFEYTVSVYTPPCFEKDGDVRYPVLYLLHGQSMDDTFWIDLGAVKLADERIVSGAAPFLMVMPYEVKNYDPVTESAFGDSVMKELIPWVERTYPVCTTAACRAIGGISRGGGWAVRLAMRNFGTFSTVGAHSMGLMAGDWWQTQNLAQTQPLEKFPRIYMDRGEDDYLAEDIDFYEKVLTDNKIPHEFHIYPGGHERSYWQAHVEEYMDWYIKGW